MKIEGEIVSKLSNYKPWLNENISLIREWTCNNKFSRVEILVIEEFYLRINRELTVLIIFEFESETQVLVTILSTGAKKGLFQVTFGARKHVEDKYFEILREINRSNGWAVTLL
jgi:hypothetical protein